VKPWLLAILRNVCNAEFARRSKKDVLTDYIRDESLAEEVPMWQEPQASPEKMIVRRQDTATIRRLVAELPDPFREAIVLREMNNLSYQEIAQVAGVPVGTSCRGWRAPAPCCGRLGMPLKTPPRDRDRSSPREQCYEMR
jgi:RNA polymerase sigma-70 factor, ECF subfamily